MEFHPLHRHFAAEVRGFDMREPIDAATARAFEAAARHHFHKPAARLSESESALLAVTLPGPSTRNPARPGPGLRRVASIIETRARVMTKAAACVLD